jgi:hypothetical protein
MIQNMCLQKKQISNKSLQCLFNFFKFYITVAKAQEMGFSLFTDFPVHNTLLL